MNEIRNFELPGSGTNSLSVAVAPDGEVHLVIRDEDGTLLGGVVLAPHKVRHLTSIISDGGPDPKSLLESNAESIERLALGLGLPQAVVIEYLEGALQDHD